MPWHEYVGISIVVDAEQQCIDRSNNEVSTDEDGKEDSSLMLNDKSKCK